MPITVTTPAHRLSQDEFHAIDRLMLGHAFKIHNQYGRLLDESVYKAILAERCISEGVPAQREVAVHVTHGAFAKSYFIDLLLAQSTVVEIKTARTLTAAHRGQGINYLLLAGTCHGSLVNFRSFKVEREFLSTTLSIKDRQSFDVRMIEWPQDEIHESLRVQVVGLCSDLGLGLDITLYRDALAVLLNLPRVLVAVLSGTSVAGHHEMAMLSPETALVVTGLARLEDHRRHMERLLSNTTLCGMTWVNLTLGKVHLEHISASRLRS